MQRAIGTLTDGQRNTQLKIVDAGHAAIARQVRTLCEPLGHRAHAVVNYEGFVLDRDLEDPFAEMVSETVRRWYSGVTRFTTRAFMRAKLGEALGRRKLAPHIFETFFPNSRLKTRADVHWGQSTRQAGQRSNSSYHNAFLAR